MQKQNNGSWNNNIKCLKECLTTNIIFLLHTLINGSSSHLYQYKELIICYFIQYDINGLKLCSFINSRSFISELSYYLNPNDKALEQSLSILRRQILNVDFKCIRVENTNDIDAKESTVFDTVASFENKTKFVSNYTVEEMINLLNTFAFQQLYSYYHSKGMKCDLKAYCEKIITFFKIYKINGETFRKEKMLHFVTNLAKFIYKDNYNEFIEPISKLYWIIYGYNPIYAKNSPINSTQSPLENSKQKHIAKKPALVPLMTSITQNITKSKAVTILQIIQLLNYFENNSYDSDALIEDVLDTKQSNIFYYVTQEMSNTSIFDVIIESILCTENSIDFETENAILARFSCVCVCGKTLIARTAKNWMKLLNSDGILCIYCFKAFTYSHESNVVMYGCNPIRNEKYHPEGYGFCYECSSIIRKAEKNFNYNNDAAFLYYERFLLSVQNHHKNIQSTDFMKDDRKFMHVIIVIMTMQTHLKRIEELKILNDEQLTNLSAICKQLLADVLNLDLRFAMINEKIKHDDVGDLRVSVVILMFIMNRLKTTERYEELRNVYEIIEDKIQHTDAKYCVCGAALFVASLSDVFQTGVGCWVCGTWFEYSKSQKIYVCAMSNRSECHKAGVFVVCPDCISFMNEMQQQNAVNHIEEKQHLITNNSTDVNPRNNSTKFIFKQLEAIDNILANCNTTNQFDVNKWISVCHRWKIIIARMEAWKLQFTPDEKQQIDNKQQVISDEMKNNLPLCHCGDILSPNVIIKLYRTGAVACKHCFKEILYGQPVYTCIGKKCKYFKICHYYCKQCGFDLRKSFKQCSIQQRLTHQFYGCITNVISKNTKTEMIQWYRIAYLYTEYKDMIIQHDDDQKLSFKESYSHQIYKLLRKQFKTYNEYQLWRIDGKEFQICFNGGTGVNKQFKCVFNHNNQMSDIETTWQCQVVRDTDDNVFKFFIEPLAKPKYIHQIIINLVFFLPQTSFCAGCTYRYRSNNPGLRQITSFDLSTISMLTYVAVEWHMKIEAIIDCDDISIKSNQQLARSGLMHQQRSNPFKQGFLIKQSAHLNFFNKRWVVLENYVLSTYKSENISQNATELFDLATFFKVVRIEENGKNGFVLASHTNSRTFLSSSKDETNEWINKINIAINNNLKVPIDVEISRISKIKDYVVGADIHVDKLSRKFTINLPYSNHITIEEIEWRAMEKIKQIHKGTKFTFSHMISGFDGPEGWVVETSEIKIPEITEMKIQTFDNKFNDVEKCPLVKAFNNGPLLCPLYAMASMEMNLLVILHLLEFNHCNDEYMKQKIPQDDEGAASICVSFFPDKRTASLKPLNVLSNKLQINLNYKPFSSSVLAHLLVYNKLLKVMPCHIQMMAGHSSLYKHKSLTQYKRDNIVEKGLQFCFTVPKFEHRTFNRTQFCKYLIIYDEDNVNYNQNILPPINCPIYKQMIKDYDFTKECLAHLYEFEHFKDDYFNKIACRYGEKCRQYIRMENGENRLIDKCHMKLYRHPPRQRQIQLAENVQEFMCKNYNDIMSEQNKLHVPNKYHLLTNKQKSEDGFLSQLIKEVIKNGYKTDLYVNKNEKMKRNNYTIMEVVNEKMQHPRHIAIGRPLNKGEMLSLILYTGCDCNHDLCKSQRNGDYKKWKWFDLTLYSAISKLDKFETGTFTVYTG
eukprot:532415_1